jgi:hypothetical protein
MKSPLSPGTLGWGIGRTFEGNLDSQFSVTTAGYLRIHPTEPKSLEWMIDRLGRATTLDVLSVKSSGIQAYQTQV